MYLGAEKLVLINPDYLNVDERNGVLLINSEDKQYEMFNQLDYAAEKANFNIELLSSKLLNKNQTNQFNHIAMLNDWTDEVADHIDIDKSWTFIPSETEFILPLIDSIGTEHISYLLEYNYKAIKDNKGEVLFYTVLYPIFLPYGIFYALTPRYYSGILVNVYNLKTGEIEIDKNYEIKTKGTRGSMNSFMYDIFFQVQQKQSK